MLECCHRKGEAQFCVSWPTERKEGKKEEEERLREGRRKEEKKEGERERKERGKKTRQDKTFFLPHKLKAKAVFFPSGSDWHMKFFHRT